MLQKTKSHSGMKKKTPFEMYIALGCIAYFLIEVSISIIQKL